MWVISSLNLIALQNCCIFQELLRQKITYIVLKVLVSGPAYVEASTLRVIKQNTDYELELILSPLTSYGRVMLLMAERFCTDDVGNYFTRTNGSALIVHLDRRPVQGELWTSVPSYVLGINGDTRTVLATNNKDELEIFLDFSSPVVNSTQQIMNALHLKSAEFNSEQVQSQGNRRFVFKVMIQGHYNSTQYCLLKLYLIFSSSKMYQKRISSQLNSKQRH